MAKVDPIPPESELEKRRKPKYIVDMSQVTSKDDTRVRNWAAEIMKKNEFRFNTYKIKNRQIVAHGEVEPEAIDIRVVYPYPNLRWMIFRDDHNKQPMWSIMLTTQDDQKGLRVLCTTTFAKI